MIGYGVVRGDLGISLWPRARRLSRFCTYRAALHHELNHINKVRPRLPASVDLIVGSRVSPSFLTKGHISIRQELLGTAPT